MSYTRQAKSDAPDKVDGAPPACAAIAGGRTHCGLPPTPPHIPPRAPMSSDPSGPAFSPLYQQIKLLITRSLQEGEWKPGEAIPAETDLAARYRVSQGTVRKAIDELATENLLVRRQGKGTFVATHAEEQIQYRFLRLAPDDGKPRAWSATSSTASACARRRRSRARST
jgi:GntR family transcriptional regulator